MTASTTVLSLLLGLVALNVARAQLTTDLKTVISPTEPTKYSWVCNAKLDPADKFGCMPDATCKDGKSQWKSLFG